MPNVLKQDDLKPDVLKQEVGEQDNQVLDALKFIFDAHLKLFNIRRDHEWRVIISVMVLMGAVDLTLINQRIRLNDMQIVGWWLGLCILYGSVFWYQFGVQVRNRVDRIAMDGVVFDLCQRLKIPDETPPRTSIDGESESSYAANCCSKTRFHKIYLWAFWPQMLVLFVATLFSAYVPFLVSSLGETEFMYRTG